MRKWIYLVPFLSAPGCSINHYYDRPISVSSIVPRNNKLNSKAAEANSYLEYMCSNVNVHFIDNAGVMNPKKHLNIVSCT